jgi:hypothetical protein
MSAVEQLEQQVQSLSPAELLQFRAWFLAYDEQLWDQQIAADRKAGKLDKLIAEARADFQAGKARKL